MRCDFLISLSSKPRHVFLNMFTFWGHPVWIELYRNKIKLIEHCGFPAIKLVWGDLWLDTQYVSVKHVFTFSPSLISLLQFPTWSILESGYLADEITWMWRQTVDWKRRCIQCAHTGPTILPAADQIFKGNACRGYGQDQGIEPYRNTVKWVWRFPAIKLEWGNLDFDTHYVSVKVVSLHSVSAWSPSFIVLNARF